VNRVDTFDTPHTHGHAQTHTDTHRQAQTHTDTHRQAQTHTDTHRRAQPHTDTHRHRHAQTQTHTHTHAQTYTDIHRHAQTRTDTHRHTHTHTGDSMTVATSRRLRDVAMQHTHIRTHTLSWTAWINKFLSILLQYYRNITVQINIYITVVRLKTLRNNERRTN